MTINLSFPPEATGAMAIGSGTAGIDEVLRLANTMMDSGQPALAVKLLSEARQRHPRDARIANNLGLCRLQMGDAARAAAELGAALALRPGYYGALVNLGQARLALGDARAALDCFDRAARGTAAPSADLEKARATALRGLDRPEEAAAALDRAVALAPHDAQARIDLGILRCLAGRFAEGAQQFIAVLEADPANWLALFNLGMALAGQNHTTKAQRCFEAALAINPGHADSANALGIALMRSDRLAEAEAAFETALAAKPRFDAAWSNLAGCRFQRRQFGAAAQAAQSALALAPDNDEYRAATIHYHLHTCDWSAAEAALAEAPDVGARTHPIMPFTLLAAEDLPERQRARSVLHAKTILPPLADAFVAPAPRSDGRIRVGYFSSDFYNHATMHLLSGLLRHHDRTRFEIVAFSYGSQVSDAMRDFAIANVDRFLDLSGSSDAELVRIARHLELDIAVDLKGHTKDARLACFASRVAPVQMTWLGYPGTSGAEFFDYAVCDATVLPEAERASFTEQVIFLPHCYQPNDDRREISARATSRGQWNLPDSGRVLCCFNANYKIGRAEFAIWMEALRRREDAVLWLLRNSPEATENLQAAAEAAGVARERIIFADSVAPSENLERLRHADLFVDTFRYNAHTTGSDALWAGVPVLTLAGRQFAARVGASLLTAVGLPDFVARTAEDYAALLGQLLQDPDRLAAARAHLVGGRGTHPLFDTAAFTGHLEQGFCRALDLARAGRPAADIHIEAA